MLASQSIGSQVKEREDAGKSAIIKKPSFDQSLNGKNDDLNELAAVPSKSRSRRRKRRN